MNKVTPFTDDDVKIVIEMWQEGKSAVLIAERLGNDRTRNSILGLVFRLRQKMPELKRYRTERGTKIGKPQRPRIEPRLKKIPTVQINLFTPIVEETPPPEGGISYFETTRRHCKYILNTSKDAHKIKCCGASVYRESSWCRHHFEDVFIVRTHPEKLAARSPTGKTPVASVLQLRQM